MAMTANPKRLLPSEVGRLVYGYLGEVNCLRTQAVFLEENQVLKEISEFVEKEVLRSIEMEIEGHHLIDILNGFFIIKCEIDRLFDELQLKRPELYGFKTDGPLRKLKVLDAHWKSQPTNSKSYEKKKAKVGVGDHVIRAKVFEISAANSEAHRMLSKKATFSPEANVKNKLGVDACNEKKTSQDLKSSNQAESGKSPDERDHSKSRKSQLKSRIPTRGAGISMPILSGFEMEHEVKKRIEAFTQKTDDKIINSVVAEPLAHILANINEVDRAVENFLSNEDLLNNFTQVLDEVWETDCRKVNEQTALSSGLLSTPQHHTSEFSNHYLEQDSSLEVSALRPESPINTPETNEVTFPVESSPNSHSLIDNGSKIHKDSNGEIDFITPLAPLDIAKEGDGLDVPPEEQIPQQGEEAIESSCNDFEGGERFEEEKESLKRVDVSFTEPISSAHNETLINPPLAKRHPQELPLLEEQEVHLVNPSPCQEIDRENHEEDLAKLLPNNPQVIIINQNQALPTPAETEKDFNFGFNLEDPTLKLIVVLPEAGESSDPQVIVTTGLVNDHQALEIAEEVAINSLVSKSELNQQKYQKNTKESKTSIPKARKDSDPQLKNLVRKSNRLALKRNPSGTIAELESIEVKTKRKKKSTTQQTSCKDSLDPKAFGAPKLPELDTLSQPFQTDDNARPLTTPTRDSNSPSKDKQVNTNGRTPSFERLFKARKTPSPKLTHMGDSKSLLERENSAESVQPRQDCEGSQTLSSLSQLFSPLSQNLSISSTVLNEILKTSCGATNFAELNCSGLFTEAFNQSNLLQEQNNVIERKDSNSKLASNEVETRNLKQTIMECSFQRSPKQSSTPRSLSFDEEGTRPQMLKISTPDSQLPLKDISVLKNLEEVSPAVCVNLRATETSDNSKLSAGLDFVSPSKRLPRKVPLVRVPITDERVQPGQFCSKWEERHNVNNLDNYTTRTKLPEKPATPSEKNFDESKWVGSNPNANSEEITSPLKRHTSDILPTLPYSDLTFISYQVYFQQDPYVEDLDI